MQIGEEAGLRYVKDGYLLVRQALKPEALEALASDTARMFDAPLQDKVFLDQPVIWCWRHRPDGKRSVFPLSDSKVITDLATNPEMHRAYRALTGSDNLQLFECVVFDKPAGIGEAFAWHNDHSLYPVSPGRSISLWIAIDRCDEETGALQFAAGSHHHGKVRSVDVKTGAPMAGSDDKAALPDPAAAGYKTEMLIMEPGDAVFFDADTWHASPPNRSQNRRRRGMVMRFWLEPNKYVPSGGTAAAFMRQITCQVGDYIQGPCFPAFKSGH
jgi:hypothetical protein